MSRDLSLAYGYQILYPQDDHVIEFYPWMAQADDISELPYDMPEEAKERREKMPEDEPSAEEPAPEVREAFMADYRDLIGGVSLPSGPSDTLMGEGVGEMIGAIATGRREICIVNIPNNGCVPNLPQHALLEVEAVTDAGGVRGLQMGEAPAVLKGILEKRIVW